MDNKNFCVGIYGEDDNIHSSLSRKELTHTWDYHPHLFQTQTNYAKIYCNGLTLNQVCPESLKNNWEKIKQEKQKFLKTFQTAKVCLKTNCFYDLVPDFFLKDYFGIKNEITRHTFNVYEKPENHDFLVGVWKLTDAISKQKIKHKCNEKRYSSHFIAYNIFGTITGRLAGQKGTFPILLLPKTERKNIFPTRDFFLKLDFNGAELRTAFALAGKEQPQQDVIEILQDILKTDTREKTKKKFYSWLYNPNKNEPLLETFLNKDDVLKKHFDGEKVKNTFGRIIKTDDFHALSYLNQSETNDTFLEKAVELFYRLRRFETKIAFLVHDELVLDVKRSEIEKLKPLLRNFGNTRHGHYLLNIAVGMNYGEMKKWVL